MYEPTTPKKPLYDASSGCHVEIVNTLLQHEANMSPEVNEQRSSLQATSENEHSKSVGLLPEYRASTHLKDEIHVINPPHSNSLPPVLLPAMSNQTFTTLSSTIPLACEK
jgi:hypothetical protein